MSKDAQRGLAAIRGLFSKAASMGGPADDDELEANLEEDFEELDQAAAETPPAEADGSEYAEDEEEKEAPPPDEAEMVNVGKAAHVDGEDDGDGEDVDAGPILADIAKAWQGTHRELRMIRQQNALLAKGLMGLVDEQETVAKNVDDVQREVNETPRLPKAGRRPRRPQPKRGEQLDVGAIVSKAVTDTGRFSARDVAKLESMLGRGAVDEVRREFEPDQIQALGLSAKN